MCANYSGFLGDLKDSQEMQANHCRTIFIIFVLAISYSWAKFEVIDQQEATNIISWTGEDVYLPCGDIESESVNRYWKRGEDILTMANIVWTSNSRIESLNDSIILRINNVSVDDEGQYTCVVNSKPIQKLTIELQVKEFRCGAPEKPLNGDFKGDINSSDIDSYTVNDQIQYFCNRGFEIVGSAIRTCSGPPHGWTPDEPFCEPDYIVRLHKSMAVIGNKVTALENKITTLENKITTLEYNVTSLDSRMTIQEVNCRTDFIKLGDECYYFSTEQKSWHDALTACQSLGSTLAYPKNSKENKLLMGYISRTYRDMNFWIGGTDEAEEGTWVWTHDQSPITYFDWLQGQPNNGGRFGQQDCTLTSEQYSINRQWLDAACNDENEFVCQ